jgi:hypothetical protein
LWLITWWYPCNYSFKTQPDGSTQGWNRFKLKKKQGKEKLGVTRRGNPARHGTKLGCNPLTFVFLLKRHRFNSKKLTRTIRWSDKNLKPGSWIRPPTELCLKTMLVMFFFFFYAALVMFTRSLIKMGFNGIEFFNKGGIIYLSLLIVNG